MSERADDDAGRHVAVCADTGHGMDLAVLVEDADVVAVVDAALLGVVGVDQHPLLVALHPPPLLSCVEDGALVLHDGNHRYEALQRAGAEAAWVLVWFDDPGERAAFAARVGLPAPGLG